MKLSGTVHLWSGAPGAFFPALLPSHRREGRRVCWLGSGRDTSVWQIEEEPCVASGFVKLFAQHAFPPVP